MIKQVEMDPIIFKEDNSMEALDFQEEASAFQEVDLASKE